MRIAHDKEALKKVLQELEECPDNPCVSLFIAGRHIRHRHSFSHASRLADEAYNIVSHRHGHAMGRDFKDRIFESYLTMSWKRDLKPGYGVGIFLSQNMARAAAVYDLKRSFVMVAKNFHVKLLFQEIQKPIDANWLTQMTGLNPAESKSNRLLVGLEDVASQLPKGGMRSLLLASNKILWGYCDDNTGKVERVMNPFDTTDGDLLNHLLLWARKHTTPVAIMDCDDMPMGSPVAAIVDYEKEHDLPAVV